VARNRLGAPAVKLGNSGHRASASLPFRFCRPGFFSRPGPPGLPRTNSAESLSALWVDRFLLLALARAIFRPYSPPAPLPLPIARVPSPAWLGSGTSDFRHQVEDDIRPSAMSYWALSSSLVRPHGGGSVPIVAVAPMTVLPWVIACLAQERPLFRDPSLADYAPWGAAARSVARRKVRPHSSTRRRRSYCCSPKAMKSGASRTGAWAARSFLALIADHGAGPSA